LCRSSIECVTFVSRFAIGKVSVIFVAAWRKNDRLVLELPVDESAFGSPLIAPEGIGALESAPCRHDCQATIAYHIEPAKIQDGTVIS